MGAACIGCGGGGDTKKVGEERAEQAEGRQRCQHCDELCRPQLCGSAPPPPPPEPAASKGARAQLCRGRRGPWGLLFLPLPSPSASFPSCTVRVLERKKKKIQTKKEKRDPGSGGAVPVLTPTAPALGPPIPCRAPRWGGAGGAVRAAGPGLQSCTAPRTPRPHPGPSVWVGSAYGAREGWACGGGGCTEPCPTAPTAYCGARLGTHCRSAPIRRAPSIPLRPPEALPVSPSPAGPAAPRGPAPVGAEHCRAGGSRGQPRYAHGTDPARRCTRVATQPLSACVCVCVCVCVRHGHSRTRAPAGAPPNRMPCTKSECEVCWGSAAVLQAVGGPERASTWPHACNGASCAAVHSQKQRKLCSCPRVTVCCG